MPRLLRVAFVAVCLLVAVGTVVAQNDLAGSKDYPGVSRFPGYYIAEYRDAEFDTYTFKITQRNNTVEQPVEGRRIDLRYNLKDNVKPPSALQVVRNYQNAARAIGGQILLGDSDSTTIRLNRDGKEVWLSIRVGNEPSGTPVWMSIIEKQGMQQDVTIDAKAMADGLSSAGKVAIYGIFFDTGKSDLKPESDAAIAEIAKLLKEQPALKVFIVGHTDMAGDPAMNVKLSQARAQSVISALVAKHGIAGTRLVPFGNGPYAPVASNKDDGGRAKNRRVELVEIATR